MHIRLYILPEALHDSDGIGAASGKKYEMLSVVSKGARKAKATAIGRRAVRIAGSRARKTDVYRLSAEDDKLSEGFGYAPGTKKERHLLRLSLHRIKYYRRVHTELQVFVGTSLTL